MKMSEFIRIQSKVTIAVTCGLQHQDVTNPDAHIPDRLKVSPEWPKATMLIRAGVHNYPAEIRDWPTVKALERDEIITIGEATTVSEEDEKKAEELEQAIETIEPKKRKRNRKLEEATE